MPRFGFAIDNRACIGCHACTVACKAEHDVPIGVNRTWVKYIEKGTFPNTRRYFSVQRCNHCHDAPCVDICPVTSLYRRPDGIVDFDGDRCIGCKACMQACPYDALYLDPESNTAAKCNYCTHRVDAGYEPACVIVCPVEAIVSGDLDDPDSRIGQLDRMLNVQYPKVEKGTRPKLFYVGGETAALDPAAAPPSENYLWSGNDGRITRDALRLADREAEDEVRARRVYDVRAKPAPWGWMVSAYVTTKAVATGVVIVSFILFVMNHGSGILPPRALGLSLIFLAITGALLVGDLKRPERFLYVLLRPQWKSWLVRGAYLITLMALLGPLCGLISFLGAPRTAQLALGWPTSILAAAVAAYTALLFAQAKGRDYWQNPLLVVSMLIDALVAGAAALCLIGPLTREGSDITTRTLAVGTALLAILLVAEMLPHHQTKNAELTGRIMTRGSLRWWFWGGVVVVGLVAPAAAILGGASTKLAGALLLVGIACRNHVQVQAPQRVPLS